MKIQRIEKRAAQAAKEELVFDVVCGMELVRKDAFHLTHLNGMTYYFCSSHCKRHFVNTPTRYVQRQPKSKKR